MTESKIQWTDRVWNPVRGCSRVSEGCRNCYAERQAARFNFERNVFTPGDLVEIESSPFKGFVRIANGHPQWTGKVELVESKLTEPLRWRKPSRIFVNSMSDLFHEALPFDDIIRVFAVMGECPHHTFQILTKRPERMRMVAKKFAFDGGFTANGFSEESSTPYLPNVWLGVSVENQKTADERIPLLLQTPAAKRFVSYEPVLGPVDCSRFLTPMPRLDWVIVGGESGPGARLFDVQWARNVVLQCKSAGVACFVKQLGSKPFAEDHTGFNMDASNHEDPDDNNIYLRDRKGGDMEEWPNDLRVREFPA